MQFDINFMFTAIKESIKYTPVTLILAFVPFIAGIFFGSIIALVRLYKIRVFDRVFQVYIVITKGVPVMLQILIVYYFVFQTYKGVAEKFHLSLQAKEIELIYIALLALFIYGTAGISESIRGALISINKGQYESGYSVGMTRSQTLRRIIIPQALPIAVPMLCSNLIGLVKSSSLVLMISVVDLMNAALIPANTSYKYLEAYVAAAIVYWIINIGIEKTSLLIESRLSVYRKEGVL
ncbi:amino acid ABC transporter permease [Clostridium aminobutyricum]|uniref:Amino acid ABC transporter permease n=1 Tax=Clostridium aminobutyricum TaxID=33953 RepID=A0A939D6P0_CLOAM|nr:amino acid ABC transporter permease [Clostridium aminobutyricum]MBN7772232.1 amino acid ABC transporter permease [Clostridium aminobutyricum]